MKLHSILRIGVILVVVFGVGYWIFSWETVYEGKSTSEWIRTLETGSEADRNDAVLALQHIGEEAVARSAALVTHADAEVGAGAFDVLEGVLAQSNANFETMNCAFGFVSGRGQAIRAIPPIATAVTGCLFGEDETLWQRAEVVVSRIPWRYAVKQRAAAEQILNDLCRGLESEDEKRREQAARLFESIIFEVTAYQGELRRPTANRLLDIAVKQGQPSKALLRSVLQCLVMSEEDEQYASRVQAIEADVVRVLDGTISLSEPQETGLSITRSYDDDAVRYWAARALLRYGSRDAIPALCEARQDENDNVSRTAIEALRKLGFAEQCGD